MAAAHASTMEPSAPFDGLEQQLQRVEFAYKRQRGVPAYTEYVHRGQPPRYPPFALKLPVLFLPWDRDGLGLMALFHPSTHQALASADDVVDDSSHIGICRCGVVKYSKYFHRQPRSGLDRPGTFDVAIKVMDKAQVQLQHDDVEHEVRVMAQLQRAGFEGVYNSPHFSQWECYSDAFNEYIATDHAANGSLVLYVKKRVTQYKREAVTRLVAQVQGEASLEGLEAMVHACVAQVWTMEALRIFDGIVQGLVFMHAQNICHLDLDPCNVVIDTTLTPRIIDFGSSEIMSNNGYAGADDRLIKFKPLYVAQEVRHHNLHPPPRPGFLGAAADMWSAGVLLYQLLCFGYPKGHLALVCDTNWHRNLLCHAEHLVTYGHDGIPDDLTTPAAGVPGCLGQEGCLICFRRIKFPATVYDIFRGLLIADRPADRLSAFAVTNMLQPLLQMYDAQATGAEFW